MNSIQPFSEYRRVKGISNLFYEASINLITNQINTVKKLNKAKL